MLRPMNAPAVSVASARTRLALSAFVLLFVELALIRWLGANIIYLAYFSNFVLVGSFLGIGLGFLWASRSERSLFPWAAVALSAFVAMVRLFDINIEVGGSNLIFFADQRPVGPPRWIMLPIVFAAVALCVAAIADGVARNFRRLAPLDAYRWELVGSILGVVGFSALAFLGSPPVVWGAIVGSLLLGLAWNHGVSARRWGAASLLLLVAVLGVESFGGSQAWSPYYALSWDEHDEGGIVMRINDVATWDQHPKHEAAMYDFVYDFRTAEEVGDVLIIGAGSGNDVSVALGHGAERVDAVEIDPVILDLARTHHPGQPYADDRVNVHIDDGRAFTSGPTASGTSSCWRSRIRSPSYWARVRFASRATSSPRRPSPPTETTSPPVVSSGCTTSCARGGWSTATPPPWRMPSGKHPVSSTRRPTCSPSSPSRTIRVPCAATGTTGGWLPPTAPSRCPTTGPSPTCGRRTSRAST